MPAGYSKTPLVKKLGIKEGFHVHFVNPPAGYFDLLNPLPDNLIYTSPPFDFVQIFVNTTSALEEHLLSYRSKIVQDGMIWISWYKKASKLPTELNEDVIRNTALALGMVDIKVCAVNKNWSGLKIVILKENRTE